MSGIMNKIKEAVSGHPTATDEHSTSTGTGTGVSSGTHAGHTSGPHNYDTENKLDPRTDSDNSRYGTSGTTGGVGSGARIGETGPHNSEMANRIDPRVDTTANMGQSGNLGTAHQGIDQGVENTRLTSMGHIGQLDEHSSSGGFNSTGARAESGQHHNRERELEAGAVGAGALGAEEHHRHHKDNMENTGGLNSSSTTGAGYGGLNTGSTGTGSYGTGSTDKHHRHERELEAGAVGAGVVGAEHHRHHHDNTENTSGFNNSGTTTSGFGGSTTGMTGTGGYGSGNTEKHHRHERELEGGALGAGALGAEEHHRHHHDHGNTLTNRGEVEQRLEPHTIAGENMGDYTSPSSFSHGKHDQLGDGRGATGGYGTNTSGIGGTGTGLTSGTGGGLGNERERLAGSNMGGNNTTGSGYDASTGNYNNEAQFGALHPSGERGGRTSNTVDLAPGSTGSGLGGTGNRNL